MANRVEGELVLEDARIIFRNFSGEERTYNPAGKRNFCVILDKDIADTLVKDGWNVKQLVPREEGDEPTLYLPVEVSYRNRPPKVVLVTKRSKTELDESTVGQLDYADIKSVDLIVNPYNWEVNGKSGVKAYVKTMYVVLEEDPLAGKYDDPDDDDLPF